MNKVVLMLSLIIFLAMPSFAELTVNDATSREYLINHGHSTAHVNAIRKSIAQANGEELAEPIEREYYQKPAVNFIRRVFMYLDPGLDDHTFENDYQIKPTPRFDEL